MAAHCWGIGIDGASVLILSTQMPMHHATPESIHRIQQHFKSCRRHTEFSTRSLCTLARHIRVWPWAIAPHALVLHKKTKVEKRRQPATEKSNSSLCTQWCQRQCESMCRPATTQRAHCSNCVSQETASYSSVTLHGYVRSVPATCPCVYVCPNRVPVCV